MTVAPNSSATLHFRADQVLRMVEAGILAESARCELLRGELLEKAPRSPLHSLLVSDLAARFGELNVTRGWHVRVEQPVACGEWSLPEPDVSVVSGRARDYRTAHPSAARVVLLVEVAVSSLPMDREKMSIYAEAGVAECWIIDAVGRTLEQYRGPMPDGRYREIRVLAEHEVIVPPGTDVVWSVADLLG